MKINKASSSVMTSKRVAILRRQGLLFTRQMCNKKWMVLKSIFILIIMYVQMQLRAGTNAHTNEAANVRSDNKKSSSAEDDVTGFHSLRLQYERFKHDFLTRCVKNIKGDNNTHDTKRNIAGDYLLSSQNCVDVGSKYIESTLQYTRKGREVGKLSSCEEQYHYLLQAEEQTSATVALLLLQHDDALRDNNKNVSTANTTEGSTNDTGRRTLRDRVSELYIAMGIINRERNLPEASRRYFLKALEIQPDNNHREAKWQLSQLPSSSTLAQQLGRNRTRMEGKEKGDGKSVLCCICMDEMPYIDEFVDYHLGIGFRRIVIYDNTELNEMVQWGHRRGNDTVTVIHYPGLEKQGLAYLDCAKNALEGRYGNEVTWAAFWDVDEFLVMKRHNHVDDLFEEHLDSGALGMNWYRFGPSGQTVYQPLPVTKRFVYREERTNIHVKSVARLRDMDVETVIPPNPHFPKLLLDHGSLHDTNGHVFDGAANERGPSDVAVIHHYTTKSFQEYTLKRIRGRADQKGWTPKNPGPEYQKRIQDANSLYQEALQSDGNVYRSNIWSSLDGGTIPLTFDDSAWHVLKRVAPKYAMYDEFHSGAIH